MSKHEDVDFFKGRGIIVTGAGRGIGQAVAEEFGKYGASLHLIARGESVNTVAQGIRDAGGKAQSYTGSVSDSTFAAKTVQAITEKEPVDILVNCAAILGPEGPFIGQDPAAFQETMDVNVSGNANFMRLVLPQMEARGFGRIVNFAGGGAAFSYPMFSAYGTSKAALVRLTEIVADEIKSDNVTANIIAPGAVETEMLAEVRRRGGAVRTTTHISEPVKLVVFLSGPHCSHVNGRFIHARDSYTDPSLFSDRDMLRLRRTERR